ncbi:MAG: preprotein translocase subunit SecE [Ignavibacteria bacterium]|jgi:preprotein translocase subunit SecE|nr:preprotein translocase subunit SecE [Ignavibacteria bacterium]MBP6508961.1 preprotein translocase subunit SecE [Candidatus Kapabacteria bacterium]HLP29029.1 preprotein translocase subunit SecE [Candidatus Didemnitutus sp.]MBK6419429.1 preprotein translocase subunit SecE [Ignavibacteria bacterium]MBK6759942.1 preprotein translocase subunit SecE [Ignavibacteria bacterium]
MIEGIRQFFTEVNKEMKKVSWPTRDQLQESTMVVVVTCLIIAAIVFIIDQGMTFVMKSIY